MIGLKPIKIPSAKERVASELRKAILSKQLKEGENLTLESVAVMAKRRKEIPVSERTVILKGLRK